MTFDHRRPFLALALALITLAGCASTAPATKPLATAAPKHPVAAASDLGDKDLSAAMGLLYKGDAVGARKLLVRTLKRRPGDPTATSLVRQIDTAPETLLGGESFAYTTRPNDSLSLLAERFLGDPVLFYALARYNHIDTPGALEPGRTLRIPGHERPETPRVQRPVAEPRPAAAIDKPAEPRVVPPSPTTQATNPRRASQLREAALEQMNRGAIDRAVVLFQQASRLDPGNALIQRDLDRALRISRAVHAKS
jgi:hypothetical protein